MSASNRDEVTELSARAKELQASLDVLNRRLDALTVKDARSDATIITSRPPAPWWKRPVPVGLASAAATAALSCLVFAAVSPRMPAAPPPAPVTIAPAPPAPACNDAPPVAPTATSAGLEAPLNTDDRRPPAPRAASPTGALTIVCLPVKCSEITDNGVALGPGHIFNRPVPAGPHVLNLRANGTTKTLRVEVPADQLKDVRMMFEPTRSAVYEPSNSRE